MEKKKVNRRWWAMTMVGLIISVCGSADQAASYLSQYFAKQGWIPQEKAR